MDIKQKRIDEINKVNKGGLIRPISHEMNRTIGMELTDGQKAMQENKRLKKRIEELEQSLEAGQHETGVMRYSIETLEIELNKVKSTIRSLDRMQDEMFQNHPSIDSYRSKKDELESSIIILKNA